MTPRSHRHHQVPVWLLRHFSWRKGNKDMLWVGSKDTRKIWASTADETFYRNDANTRTDYRTGPEGDLQPEKSDRDERILARWDNEAAPAVSRLIDLAREWRLERGSRIRFPLNDFEIWKQAVVVQTRRAWESQDRAGLGEDRSELYLDLYFERAEELGQLLPPREDLLKDTQVRDLFDVLSQNLRANFASADHPILAEKEKEFLAGTGLSIAVIEDPATEFIIGSHGVTTLETGQEKVAWLPVAPDVAVSLSNRPGTMDMGIYTDEFARKHNRAALALSNQIAGRSKDVVQELLSLPA